MNLSFLSKNSGGIIMTNEDTLISHPDPTEFFQRVQYRRHNARRLEHLASLNLDLSEQSVLELGAGVGDHTTFFLDRGCDVLSIEGREENIRVYKKNLQQYDLRSGQVCRVMLGNLENVDTIQCEPADIVYCYGLLYHIANPDSLLRWIGQHCRSLLLLETRVAFGEDEVLHPVQEDEHNVTNALRGTGCRPTRLWLYRRLKEYFPHVYLPYTQPWHEQFVLDWTILPRPPFHKLSRAVFIASQKPLQNALLSQEIPDHQIRH